MRIAPLLHIGRGVTALIGGGGKTTLMETLARELSSSGSVIMTTTTKIRRPDNFFTITDAAEDTIRAALDEKRVLCLGTLFAEGKLAAPQLSMERMAELADYVLVEADGSKRLPLKAHEDFEPVIPPQAQRTVLVVGIDGIGAEISQVCHRSEKYAHLAGVLQNERVTAQLAAKVICAEGLGDRVYINKVETAADYDTAAQLAAGLSRPVVCGSLKWEEYVCLR